jgi:hypothetical protein
MAAEGTGLRDRSEIWIARSDQDWLEAIEALYSDDTLWRSMSEASHRYARDTWSRERGLNLMADALQRLHLPIHRPEPGPR